MGCCGQEDGKPSTRCCLCNHMCSGADCYPWGTIKKICYRCKDRQEALMKERDRQNERTRTLMAGKEFK